MLKGRNVISAYSTTSQVLTTDEFGNYSTVELDSEVLYGNAYYYTFTDGSDDVTINVSGRYKITGEVGLYNSSGKDIGLGILINGQITLANTNMGKSDQSTSVTTTLDLNVGDVITMGVSCLESHIVNITVNTAKLAVETV